MARQARQVRVALKRRQDVIIYMQVELWMMQGCPI
jgi:hypothetical protein